MKTLRSPVMLLLAVVMICVAPCARGANLSHQETFQHANQLYDQGKFAAAAAAYETIQPPTAALFYNLGNAYYRQGALGQALLQYERAQRLQPRDPDIRANLRFTAERLDLSLLNQRPAMRWRAVDNLVYGWTLDEWAICELVGLWVGLGMVALAATRRKGRSLLVLATMVGLVGWCLGAGALAYRLHHDHHGPRAIVTVGSVDARFAPLPDATVHFTLGEGTAVKIRENRSPWVLIERLDGQQGWVKTDAVQRLGIP